MSLELWLRPIFNILLCASSFQLFAAGSYLTEMHIGIIIKQTMIDKGYTTVWLAKQLGCNRSAIYRIYERPTIDTGILVRISRILQKDFFKEFSVDIED